MFRHRNEDLQFFLQDSPKSSPVKSIRKTAPQSNTLLPDIAKMEISPLCGPGLYTPPITINFGGTSSPLHQQGGSENTITPQSLSNASPLPLPGGTTSAKSIGSKKSDMDMDAIWDSIAFAGLPKEITGDRSNSWDAQSSSSNTTPVDTSVIVKQEEKIKINGPEDMTKSLKSMEEKRSKRLERNRMSARMSRKRKKEMLSTLTKQLDTSMNELMALRRKSLDMLVKAHFNTDLMDSTFRARTGIVHHFNNQLESNLLPVHTQFLLYLTKSIWDDKMGLFQPGGTINAEVASNRQTAPSIVTIWNAMCEELRLSESQKKKIVSYVQTNKSDKNRKILRRAMSIKENMRILMHGVCTSSIRIEKLRSRLNELLSEKQRQGIKTKVMRHVSSPSSLQQFHANWKPKHPKMASNKTLQNIQDILEKSRDTDIKKGDLSALFEFVVRLGKSPQQKVPRKWSIDSV
jgi:hypothetical protein